MKGRAASWIRQDDAAAITTYLLHKRQRAQLPIALERFFTHAKSMN